MEPKQRELTRINREAKSCLVKWATEPVSKTVALKQLASLLVDLRAQFERNDMPDWNGRSFQYRAFVSNIFDGAGLSATQRKEVVGLLRYHVGNELRERISPEELKRAGLKVESPKQRVLQAKGTYKSVETAVKRLSEAVESLSAIPSDEINEDAREAFMGALETMKRLGSQVFGVAETDC
jgi:hypothetical protein